MRDLTWHEPRSLAEAAALLGEHGEEARLMAGGTALMLALRQRMVAAEHLVSLAHVPETRGISVAADGTLVIGGQETHAAIAAHPLVRDGWAALADMAARLANPQVRNQGTIGGNLCYGDPSTDPPACLLALGASVVLEGPEGARELGIDDFLVDYFETAIAPDEVLREVRVPRADFTTARHFRHLRTAAEHRPMINMTLAAAHDGRACRSIRIALGATVPVPCRRPEAEALLAGAEVTPALVAEAAEAVAEGVDHISDMRGSDDYRRDITRVVARRALAQMFGLQGGEE